MKAEIVYLTPELAKELLKKNVGNRNLKPKSQSSYVSQMLSGNWKENGEPIIIDKDGNIRDGQHRLKSVILANFSYNCPIITGVSPDVMDTIDTGLNRTHGDVLEFNGFKNSGRVASSILGLMRCDEAIKKGSFKGCHKRTNASVLDFAELNTDKIYRLINKSQTIHRSQKDTAILSNGSISNLLYTVGGLDFNKEHVSFIEGVVKGSLGSGSSTFYAYKKLLNAKLNKVTLDKNYVFNLIVRCWNIYSKDDMPVKKMTIGTSKLEKVIN